MNDVKGGGLTGTTVFRLGVLGARAGEQFAARIEPHGLKPKHVAVLAVLDAGQAASQQELAVRLDVAHSLVVSLADRLESLGAVARTRDPGDRRRQVLSLTARGRRLLKACETAARELDAEFTAGLTEQERAALARALAVLAEGAGLP